MSKLNKAKLFYKVFMAYVLCFLLSCQQEYEDVYDCGDAPREYVNIDLGSIPDSVLSLIPYENSVSYYFKHSSGTEIMYTSVVNTTEDSEKSSFCSDTSVTVYTKSAVMFPDYVFFEFDISMRQDSILNDTIYVWLRHSSSLSKMKIPITTSDSSKLKTLNIENKSYQGIHAVKYPSSEIISENSAIAFDSLYYNGTEGIIRFTMTNGEYYNRYEK